MLGPLQAGEVLEDGDVECYFEECDEEVWRVGWNAGGAEGVL
jgi:hypothetical protein